MTLSDEEKEDLVRQVTRSRSKRIRKFARTFDLRAEYMLGDAICNVYGVTLQENLSVTLTMITTDKTSQVVQQEGSPLLFLNIKPNQLTRIQ